MGLNHRYFLRVAADWALLIFFVFAAGATLWTVDEFLNWNVLPDWIDRYAELIVILFGIAAGLTVGAALFCSLVVVAESAAERAGIADHSASNKTWGWFAGVAVVFVLGLLVFNEIDSNRREASQARYREEMVQEHRRQVQALGTALTNVLAVVPPDLLSSLQAASPEADERVARFLSAIRSSTPHEPAISVLVRATKPYEYSSIELAFRRNHESGAEEPILKRQFYLSFPTEEEEQVVEQLFAGEKRPLNTPVRGEFINNVRASTWGILEEDGAPGGILFLKTNQELPEGGFHPGPFASAPAGSTQ